MRVDPADRPAHRGSPPPRLRARVSTAQDSRAVCGAELARSAAVGAAVARPPTIEDKIKTADEDAHRFRPAFEPLGFPPKVLCLTVPASSFWYSAAGLAVPSMLAACTRARARPRLKSSGLEGARAAVSVRPSQVGEVAIVSDTRRPLCAHLGCRPSHV